MHKTLILKDKDRIIFSSDGSGLRPLVECISRMGEGRYQLFDKIVGLASAKLITFSGRIVDVECAVASVLARDHLDENHIPLKAGLIVKEILNKDSTDRCPMEKLADKSTGNELFLHLRASISSSGISGNRSHHASR